MGTVISLNVGPIELTWSKNMPGMYHGDLFLPADRVIDPPEPDNEEPGVPVYETTLGAVVPRIELMGHTLKRAAVEYEVACQLITAHERDYAEDMDEPYVARSLLSFDELRVLTTTIEIDNLSTEWSPDQVPPAQMVVPIETLKRLPWYEQEFRHRDYREENIFDESVSAGYLVGGFDPYTALRLLAENPVNLNAKVRWDFGYLCRNGWADEDEFHAGSGDRQSFLIVSEGGSDAAMVRHAVELLYPECSDFFRYIDMEDGYPFSGTGELHKFIQGFLAMRVPLNVVAVYDNDAEGYAGFNRTSALKLSSTYRVIRLPDLAAHEAFPVTGPKDEHPCDINRRAGALESYLDLTRPGLPKIEIEWGNIIPPVGLQQGALKGKSQFMKDFLRYKGKPDRRGDYDLSRIRAVIDHIFAACVDIAEHKAIAGIRTRKR